MSASDCRHLIQSVWSIQPDSPAVCIGTSLVHVSGPLIPSGWRFALTASPKSRKIHNPGPKHTKTPGICKKAGHVWSNSNHHRSQATHVRSHFVQLTLSQRRSDNLQWQPRGQERVKWKALEYGPNSHISVLSRSLLTGASLGIFSAKTAAILHDPTQEIDPYDIGPCLCR